MMSLKKVSTIYRKAIEDYHKLDTITQDHDIDIDHNDIYKLSYKKCWIDTIQWHCEDEIRNPSISGEEVKKLKHKIDTLNQKRTDIVEQIDDMIFKQFSPVKPSDKVIINTESPAWTLDRLSILELKVYHMKIETENKVLSEKKKEEVEIKYKSLTTQRNDLINSLDRFITGIKEEKVSYHLYRQHKMYNDEELNPILRSRL